MIPYIRLRLCVFAAVLLAVTAMTHPVAAATEITDILGRKIELAGPAKRVLLGFYFEDFAAIVGPGAFERVVAISKSTWHDWRNSQWQAYVAAVPRIAELADVGEIESGTFSVEKAIAARPDVAILAKWQYDGLGTVAGQLTAAGIPVVVVDYNAQTLDKHIASTRIIGQVMGSEARAEELANLYKAKVRDVEARIAKAGGPQPKVYVELGNKGAGEYGNSYGQTMWGPLIERAGGDNIARGKIENWGPLNPEYVLASNPDLILIAGSYWPKRDNAVLMGFGVKPARTAERLRPYLKRAGWSGLSAVKQGQVHAVYHGGVRTLYDYAMLQYLAKQLYPARFADVDPIRSLRDYYRRYLPVAADGTFMMKLTP